MKKLLFLIFCAVSIFSNEKEVLSTATLHPNAWDIIGEPEDSIYLILEDSIWILDSNEYNISPKDKITIGEKIYDKYFIADDDEKIYANKLTNKTNDETFFAYLLSKNITRTSVEKKGSLVVGPKLEEFFKTVLQHMEGWEMEEGEIEDGSRGYYYLSKDNNFWMEEEDIFEKGDKVIIGQNKSIYETILVNLSKKFVIPDESLIKNPKISTSKIKSISNITIAGEFQTIDVTLENGESFSTLSLFQEELVANMESDLDVISFQIDDPDIEQTWKRLDINLDDYKLFILQDKNLKNVFIPGAKEIKKQFFDPT